MALAHAAYVYNHTPNATSGIAPIEIFSCTQGDRQALRNLHTWGCPTYVLEPKLTEAGGKIPKWKPRSRRGQYMGTSPVHADTIALIRNLKTGYISPQYRVVFDDSFETVYADEDTTPEAWENLCIFNKFQAEFEQSITPPGYQMNGSHQKNSLRLSPDKGVRKYAAVNGYTKICIPRKLPKTSNTNLRSKRLSPPLLWSTFLKQGRHRWIRDKQGRQNIGYSHSSPHFLPREPIFPNPQVLTVRYRAEIPHVMLPENR
jgi:hypothetical protein